MSPEIVCNSESYEIALIQNKQKRCSYVIFSCLIDINDNGCDSVSQGKQ